MDKKSLSYHEKVQDWSQLYRLTADGKIYKDTKEITYLTPQKIQEIDSWRNNVRKKLNKNKTGSGKLSPSGKKPPSGKGTPQLRDGIRSAGSRQAFSGTDIYTVSNHLAETSLHYSAMREDIYNTNRKGSIHKSTKQILNGTAAEVPKKIDKVIQFQTLTDKTRTSIHGSKEEDQSENELDTISVISLTSTSKMTDRGKVIQVKDKTMISHRSASNNLLNVITIDDCKMADQRQSFLYSAASNTTLETKSELDGYKTASSVISSGDLQKQENRSTTMDSCGVTSYYTSSKQGLSCKKIDRKMRVNKAIDTMINDRKVMNNMDRNFDARIAPAGRLVLEKNEGGYMFKRLHSALRRHVDNILSVQAHRRTQKHKIGSDDQFSSYLQQIASTMQKNGDSNHFSKMDESETNHSKDVSFSESKNRSSLQEQNTIIEEDEHFDESVKIENCENELDLLIYPDEMHNNNNTKANLSKGNNETSNEHNLNMKTISDDSVYIQSSSMSSISLQSVSEKST